MAMSRSQLIKEQLKHREKTLVRDSKIIFTLIKKLSEEILPKIKKGRVVLAGDPEIRFKKGKKEELLHNPLECFLKQSGKFSKVETNITWFKPKYDLLIYYRSTSFTKGDHETWIEARIFSSLKQGACAVLILKKPLTVNYAESNSKSGSISYLVKYDKFPTEKKEYLDVLKHVYGLKTVKKINLPDNRILVILKQCKSDFFDRGLQYVAMW